MPGFKPEVVKYVGYNTGLIWIGKSAKNEKEFAWVLENDRMFSGTTKYVREGLKVK